MYAIIETGGKQFRVEEGLELNIQKLDVEAGTKVDLDKILLIGQGEDIKIGAPYVEGAKVACTILEHGRDKKIIVFKKRRRQDSQTKQGHRQDYTRIKVEAIQA
ncbi:50S ribosomal protein L21 [Desulfovibrio gilichinskyi]|uniref:Large ribosomal subunit protein bL21 n=1 Tax=Desulfovibrio gilichinskyi TaxID=1519643 RepID=A0A1X7CSZ1_9BACT|nr:50S ribosomal protein L21 [Desulfovibrio gilichinskyi]SMF02639.1 LSU ribosomal protein L21P [Desulfovibrio gilichinskyi]